MRGRPIVEECEKLSTSHWMLTCLCKFLLHLLFLVLTAFTIQLSQTVTLLCLPKPCFSHIKCRIYVHFRDGVALQTQGQLTGVSHIANQTLTDAPLFFVWYSPLN